MSFDFAEATRRIAEHEGTRAKVYTDSRGHPTVGIGFNLDRQGAAAALAAVGADYERVRAGSESLTSDQIDALAKSDIENALSEAGSIVSNFDSLSAARQFVIVDMIFNLGSAGFADFHQTIAAIEKGDFAKAAEDMANSAWYGQVGSRAVSDCALMKSGEWSGTSAEPEPADHAAEHDTTEPAAEHQAAPAEPEPVHQSSAPSYPGELKEGENSEGVKEWQERLVSLGHSLTVDGAFGPGTEEATKEFQRSKGLTEDGIVGHHTWAAAWE
jgi:peptidoglycan hydrolase-like protein with peptidoglycan-binding domain